MAGTFLRRRRAERAPAAGDQPSPGSVVSPEPAPSRTSAATAPSAAPAEPRPAAPIGVGHGVVAGELPAAIGGVVRGAVLGADGWPLPDATVTVLDATGRQIGRTTTGADGTFTAAASEPGPVTVILAAPGHLPEARGADVPPQTPVQLAVVALARPGGSVLPAAGLWAIDPEHSIVRATARHLGLSRVEGRFRAFEGTIHVADPVEASSVEVTIDAGSIDTASADRDAHLRSPDFLDVERFPTLTYRSTGLVRHDDEHWTMLGRLTIRDITRDVSLDVTYAGTAPDPWGGTRMAFVASAQLARADYEMNWNMGLPTGLGLVGPTLRIDLEVQAVRHPDPGSGPSAG